MFLFLRPSVITLALSLTVFLCATTRSAFDILMVLMRLWEEPEVNGEGIFVG